MTAVEEVKKRGSSLSAGLGDAGGSLIREEVDAADIAANTVPFL